MQGEERKFYSSGLLPGLAMSLTVTENWRQCPCPLSGFAEPQIPWFLSDQCRRRTTWESLTEVDGGGRRERRSGDLQKSDRFSPCPVGTP